MFRKRIRVASAVFVTMLVLLIGCSVWWKISEKYSTGIGTLEILTGNADMVDGVSVSYSTLGKVTGKLSRNYTNLDRRAEYIYETSTATVMGNQTETGLSYEKYDVSQLRNRKCYTSLLVSFPQYRTAGMHMVSGGEISYDLKWYLEDGFGDYRKDLEKAGITEYRIVDYVTFSDEDEYLYYYDGKGPDCYEAFCMTPEDGTVYNRTPLRELNESLYGYIDMEPDIYFRCTHLNQKSDRLDVWDLEETCENIDNGSYADKLSKLGMPEVHMTVNKGVYRFDENGEAACVFLMDEYAEGFSFLWLIAEEEENTLTVIGTKENRLLAYRYDLNDGGIEEYVLWNAEGESDSFEEWVNAAEYYGMADIVSDGERNYIFYGYGCLSVFENETRVFEGRIKLSDIGEYYFPEFGNKSIDIEYDADKIEIRLTK